MKIEYDVESEGDSVTITYRLSGLSTSPSQNQGVIQANQAAIHKGAARKDLATPEKDTVKTDEKTGASRLVSANSRASGMVICGPIVLITGDADLPGGNGPGPKIWP